MCRDAHDGEELSGIPEVNKIKKWHCESSVVVVGRRSLTHHNVKAGIKDFPKVTTR
jgi:hypothetical protein